VLARLLIFLSVSALAGLLVAGLALPVTGALGLAARAGADSFEALPAELETPPLPQRSRMLDAEGRLISNFYYENRVSVPLARISPLMLEAIVAIEDSRFYDHGGVDLRGTARAFVNNQTGDSVQGGSTLTQQYVKLVLLEKAVASGDQQAAAAATSREGTDGYVRKLREVRYAVALEDRLTKEEILERYLNIAYFGSGAYGVEAASAHYFSKQSKDLTLPEAALLAGLVQSPGRWDPTRNPDLAVERRNVVLSRMEELGQITAAEAEQARAAKLALKERPVPNGCSTAAAPFFCDYVVNALLNDPTFGETREGRLRKLLRGGLTIRTTLDPDIQRAAQEAVDSRIPREDESGIATAIAMVKPGTGAILAMAQNRTWGTETDKRGVTQINYAVDKAYGGGVGFQAGSTFKPFTAAAAIQQGIPMSLPINSPSSNTFDGFENCETGAEFEPYTVKNSTRSGTFDMRDGLAWSVNTWAVGLEERTGLCGPAEIAESFGIRQAADGKPLSRVPSFTLGVDEVSPLAMAEAYATFAARGKHCEAFAVNRVSDRDGNVLPVTTAPCRRVLEAPVADAVNSLLQGVVDFGTGRDMHLGRPTAGKTGTTDDNYAVWFVGHTPNMAAAVWVGDPGRLEDGQIVRQKMRNIRINGETVRSAAGSTVAGPIWRDAMEEAVEDLPAKEFVRPDPAIVRGTPVDVPDVRGMSRSGAREALEEVGLRASVARSEVYSSAVPEGRVAYSEPGAGRSAYSGSDVVLYLSNGRPPPPPPPAPEPRETRRAEPERTQRPRPAATARPRPARPRPAPAASRPAARPQPSARPRPAPAQSAPAANARPTRPPAGPPPAAGGGRD
jgi:membrane peptidoglycan carboxypeptidase